MCRCAALLSSRWQLAPLPFYRQWLLLRPPLPRTPLVAVPSPANDNEAESFDANLRSASSVKTTKISNEYLLKAAFLYNFAKFTEWPAVAINDAAAPLRVCVLGTGPIRSALAPLHGKPVKGRRLVITLINQIGDTAICRILFICALEEDRLTEILDPVSALPILTVADMPFFAEAGGIIALKIVNGRIRFEINSAAADKAGLKLNSELLQLADLVSSKTAQAAATALN